MNILHKYTNGNAQITLWEDGTKETEWPDGEPLLVEYPTSCDLKLTNWCDMDRICLYCFVEGQMVETNNGPIPIEQINIGDMVLSYNIEKNQQELRGVEKLFEREICEEIVEIHLENGKTIEVTGNHKIYTRRGMVRADELLSSDLIIDDLCDK